MPVRFGFERVGMFGGVRFYRKVCRVVIRFCAWFAAFVLLDAAVGRVPPGWLPPPGWDDGNFAVVVFVGNGFGAAVAVGVLERFARRLSGR